MFTYSRGPDLGPVINHVLLHSWSIDSCFYDLFTCSRGPDVGPVITHVFIYSWPSLLCRYDPCFGTHTDLEAVITRVLLPRP